MGFNSGFKGLINNFLLLRKLDNKHRYDHVPKLDNKHRYDHVPKLDNKHRYDHAPKSVETSHDGKVTILWNQEAWNNRTIPDNKQDIIIRNDKQGTSMLMRGLSGKYPAILNISRTVRVALI